MSRLEIIDRLIETHGLLGRKCEARPRSRCMCEHVASLHPILNQGAHPRYVVRGGCQARGCGCVTFRSYNYAKETQARLKKLRTFALDLLDAMEGH